MLRAALNDCFINEDRFVNDRFINEDVHFLDIKIHQNNIDIYYKDTYTGQYNYYRSQTPWKLITSWIKALYHRVSKICSKKQSLNKQISQIKTFMSWNVYPKQVQNSVIKRVKTNRSRSRLTNVMTDRRSG